MARTKLNKVTRDLFGFGGLDPDEAAYIDDRYRVLRPLGEGAFATVLLCADEKKRGQLVAVKGVRTLSTRHQESLMHEFVNARRLRQANLVSVLDTGVCPTHGIYVVLEYVDGPDFVTILEHVDRVEPHVAAEVCRQVARGLAHMHKSGLVHRDVKPDNVYLEGSRAKLGDFGASRTAVQPGTGSATVIYTPGYAAPEVTQGRVGTAADAFALGALYHLAVVGDLPPTPSPRARTPQVSKNLRKYAGARAEQLIKRLLHPNPTRRLSDMREIQRRFAAMVAPSSRRELRALVEAANRIRQRADLEKRWAEFEQRFSGLMKPFPPEWVCVECRGPVSESMLFCCWCGDLLRFRTDATFPRYCARCEHGLHEDWAWCPWCGERYAAEPGPKRRAGDRRYEDSCTQCRGPMMRYMSFCPWCGDGYTWHTRGMSDTCHDCGFSVESELFGFCPWCGDLIDEDFAEQAKARIRAARSRT